MAYVPKPESDGKRRYGTWAGNPRGRVEDPARCVVSVHRSHTVIPGQCDRKRGHGPNGAFCKQHAKHASADNLAGH